MTRAIPLLIVVLFSSFASAELTSSWLDFAVRSHAANNGLYSTVGQVLETGSSRTVNGIWLLGLEYRSRVSDQYQIIWAPFPLGIQYQVQNDSQIQAVGSWSLGLAHFGVLGMKPRFNGLMRQKIDGRRSFEVAIEYYIFIPFNARPALGTLGLATGLRSQLSNLITLVPSIQLLYNDIVLRKLASSDDDFSRGQDDLRLTIPISVLCELMTSDSNRLGFEYSYRGLGLPQRYDAHIASISFSTTW